MEKKDVPGHRPFEGSANLCPHRLSMKHGPEDDAMIGFSSNRALSMEKRISTIEDQNKRNTLKRTKVRRDKQKPRRSEVCRRR